MTGLFASRFRPSVGLTLLTIASSCYGMPRISGHDAGGGHGGSAADGTSGTGAMTGASGASGTGGANGGRGGFAGAGGSGGCSALSATDPKNCGACGHDCLGGTCEGAVCKPFKLAGIPQEAARTIGLAADFLLGGAAGLATRPAPILFGGEPDWPGARGVP